MTENLHPSPKMSRSSRTTKKQKEFVINFLSENKVLLGGKINPSHLPKINKSWEDMTKSLNEIGPCKTIKQWKESISEMKTNVRRRARDVRYGTTGTGGGAGVKPLTDLEERLLSLLSNLTVEGDNLPEPGVVIQQELDIANIPIIYAEEEMQEENNIGHNNEESEVAGGSNENTSLITGIDQAPTPVKTQSFKAMTNKKIGVKRIGSRKALVNRNRGVVLEEHDKTIRQLANSNYKLAQSIHALAGALNKIANKM